MANFNGSNLLQPRVLCCSLLFSSAVLCCESAPTLGLKAISLRIISTVKSPVKSILRMFMALLKLLVCPWCCKHTKSHTHTHMWVIGVRGISHRLRHVRLRFRGCRVHAAHLHGQTDGVEKDEREHQVLKVGGVDHVPHLVLIRVLGDVAAQRARL